MNATLRALVRTLVLGPLRAFHRWLARVPRVRSAIGDAARALGLGAAADRIALRHIPAPLLPPISPSLPLDPATLSAEARRQFDVLRRASLNRKDA